MDAPVPASSDWTTGEPRLVVHCCDGCREVWYLPRERCLACRSSSSTPVTADGDGLCVAVSRVYVGVHGSDEPLGLVLVELDEGPVVMGRVQPETTPPLGPGDRVQVSFLRGEDEQLLPHFTRKVSIDGP